MQVTWKTYKEKLSSSPFELKDGYSSPQSKDIKIKSKSDVSEGVLFLARNLEEEVMNGSKKQQKKNIKELRRLLTRFAIIATTAGIGMATAQPLTAEASSFVTTATNTPTTPEITPSTVMNWGLTIALIVVSIGVAMSISLLAIAGIYLMVTRRRKQVEEWNSDIIKGLVQVLVAIPLIYSLFHLAQTVFRNLPFLEGLM